MKRSRDFGAIFDRHFDEVYGYVAYRVAPDRDAAEDITQEVFLAAMKSFSRFRGEASPLTWLRSIARNKVSDHFRASGRDPLNGEIAAESLAAADGGEMSDGQERAMLVSLAMRRIPAQYAELLEDKYIEGLSVKEIARRQGMSEKAVESALFRSRESFRERFEQLRIEKEAET